MGKTNRKAGKDKNEKDKHNSSNSTTTFNKKSDIDTKRSLRKRQNRQAYQYDSQEEKDLVWKRIRADGTAMRFQRQAKENT